MLLVIALTALWPIRAEAARAVQGERRGGCGAGRRAVGKLSRAESGRAHSFGCGRVEFFAVAVTTKTYTTKVAIDASASAIPPARDSRSSSMGLPPAR